jgi:prepilin-type processing-associated H-X9-DG protein
MPLLTEFEWFRAANYKDVASTALGKIALAAGAGGRTFESPMKTLSTKGKISGFTLIEVLVILAVIFVLAAMILPSLTRPHIHGGPSCMNNQKQLCLGLILWQSDNDGKFPWQLSVATNGTMELITNGHAASQFYAFKDYVRYTGCYICPADKGRNAATNFDHFTDENISYFVNVDVMTNTATIILTGDRRFIVNGQPVKPGLFYYKNTSDLDWARELHGSGSLTAGVMGFADGHVERVNSTSLDAAFRGQGLVSDRLEVP